MDTEKLNYLRKIVNLAKANGLCRTQKEFAALLGIDHTGLSMAMNGKERALTDSLIGKVRAFSLEHGLEDDHPAQKQGGGFWIPEETATMYNNMSETIRLQAEMIARLQGIVLPTQKNSLRDNK